jgi:type II secretory pathway pseudopilin PulG
MSVIPMREPTPMKNTNMNSSTRRMQTRRAAAGFTLLEFLVAMSMFIVIGGAVFELFRQNAPIFNMQQTLAGLNLQMQNAVTQLQQDLVNAGSGYYTGANIPTWPVGVTIINSDTSQANCFTASTFTYGSTCFDTLNIITTDSVTTPSHPGTGGANCVNSNSSPFVVQPPTGFTATTYATHFKSGDELLLVNSTGQQMTTITLTAAGTVSGSNVQLSFNATNSDGTNSTSNDPLGITTHANSGDNPSSLFGIQYCNADWVLRLQPITYSVSTATASDPQLMRTQNGTSNLIADQIIGFRVGAALWNDTHETDAQAYNYNASTFGTGYDFTLVRSVRVSMIGRTTPGATGIFNFQNGFDGGPYQILPAVVVVNPRNLTMDGTQQ